MEVRTIGTGKSNLYIGTYGSGFKSGSIDYMDPTDDFSRWIKRRKDIDANGFFDVIAHGATNIILVQHNGKSVKINHRTLSRLLSNNNESAGKAIRLLSCNTGKIDSGFAQNLANKLNLPVQAPTEYLWVNARGTYFVAEGKLIGKDLYPVINRPGIFKTFYPRRRKKQ